MWWKSVNGLCPFQRRFPSNKHPAAGFDASYDGEKDAVGPVILGRALLATCTCVLSKLAGGTATWSLNFGF